MPDIPPITTTYTNQSLSAIHHTLRASRRRLVIELVSHRAIRSATTTPSTSVDPLPDHEVSVRRLAKEIVAIEDDVTVEAATGEAYHNVYTALIQTHLPALDDVRAIDYDGDRKTLTPDDNLLALAMAAAVTSPVAQLLFQDAVAELYNNGSLALQSSTDD